MQDPTPQTAPDATILVCYHKFSKPIIASETLRPIIVGAANMGEEAAILQEKLESKLPKKLRLGGGQQIALDSSSSLSSRAFAKGAAIHNSAPAESINQSRTLSKVRNLESVVGGLGGVRGDKGGDFAIQAPLSPLQKNSLPTTLESSENVQKVDSNQSSSRADDKNNSAPDCHANAGALARNDGSSAQKPTPFVLRDDSGDNISHLNPNFCELTAMYWAWKNVDSSYYGLFHYRRVLDLSEQAQSIRTDYPIILPPSSYNPKRQGLTSQNIAKLLARYDIILPQGYKNHYDLPCDEGLDNYGIYAHYHHAKDLDAMVKLINARYPHMQSALEEALHTYPPRWHIANVFIMRKDLYFAYCEWLFSLLFALSEQTDLSDYTPYQARIYGFLSERMFNIWLAYQKQTSSLKILEAPMLLFSKHTKPLIGWDINQEYKRFYLFGVRLYKAPIKPKS